MHGNILGSAPVAPPMGGRLALAVVLLLVDCRGWRLQPGLSNVPAANRPWGDDDFAHDFVSNGDETCPSAAGGPEASKCFYSSRKRPLDPFGHRRP